MESIQIGAPPRPALPHQMDSAGPGCSGVGRGGAGCGGGLVKWNSIRSQGRLRLVQLAPPCVRECKYATGRAGRQTTHVSELVSSQVHR